MPSITFPSAGVDYVMIRAILVMYGFDEKEIDHLVKVCTIRPSETPKTLSAFSVDGVDAEEDVKRINLLQDKLMKETGRPFITLFGCDNLIAYYGAESATRIANIQVSRVREKQSLCMMILKPGYREVAGRLAAMADVHMKITEKYGSVLVYGVKPSTNLYVLEMDVSKGYPMPVLTPVI
jgi:hypothetical protein